MSRPHFKGTDPTSAQQKKAAFSPLTHVVQRIHHEPKALDPLQVILRLFDIPMSCMDVDAARRVEMPRRRSRNERFGLGYVRLAEKELAVQVGQVDRVQVDLSSAQGPPSLA